ncbi:MAG: cytochrome c [Pseudobdellovibrionaceae bacterium]|nr:cytochrome c [Pseudobdellovibrionaceae bacterium]
MFKSVVSLSAAIFLTSCGVGSKAHKNPETKNTSNQETDRSVATNEETDPSVGTDQNLVCTASSDEGREAYSQFCAGCHGVDAKGGSSNGKIYPQILNTNKTAEQFKEIVRSGLNGGMPAFSGDRLADAKISAIYGILTSGTSAGGANSPCIPAEDISPEQLKIDLAVGLATFRKVGHDGLACVNCHAPDGIDLARIGYSDSTILRRALAHVDAEDGQKLVRYVHALRKKNNYSSFFNPKTFHPFQPGGEALPGKTLVERDLTFGASLKENHKLNFMADAPVLSLEAARAAADEIISVDLHNLKVGIDFDRWTSDEFNGEEFRSFSEWIPATGFVERESAADQKGAIGAHDPSLVKSWTQIQDDYLADPTDENFWKMFDWSFAKLKHKDAAFSGSALNALSLRKYHSMLIGQHMLRKGSNAMPDALTNVAYRNKEHHLNHRHPFWELGDLARASVFRWGEDQGPCFSITPCMGVPVADAMRSKLPSLAVSKDRVRRYYQNDGYPDDVYPLRATELDIRNTWFWLGWINEPAQLLSQDSGSNLSCEYFCGFMPNFHRIFSTLRMSLERGYRADLKPALVKSLEAPAGSGLRFFSSWGTPGYFFCTAGFCNIENNYPYAAGSDADKLFRRAYSNAMLTVLYLRLDELKRLHGITGERNNKGAVKARLIAEVPGVKARLIKIQPSLAGNPAVDLLFNETKAALETAQEYY